LAHREPSNALGATAPGNEEDGMMFEETLYLRDDEADEFG